MAGEAVSFVPPVAAPWASAASGNAAASKTIVKNNAAIGMLRSYPSLIPEETNPTSSASWPSGLPLVVSPAAPCVEPGGKNFDPRLTFRTSPSSTHKRFLIEQMAPKYIPILRFALLMLALAAVTSLAPPQASAAPTAEVAKRCLHYAYIIYPFKRPGAAPASGDREAYFRDCLGKNGEVPEPARPPKKP